MTELRELLSQTIRKRRLLRRGQRLLVAVSSGVDSMVLLHLLRDLARENGWRLSVAHLNHQLRGRSSQADEKLVRRTAAALGLPFLIESANVREFARAHKLSIEMAARKLRHAFLARAAARYKAPTIALAHHADDQLELFFLRLLRGSSGDGLTGMKWRNRSPSDPGVELVRPLLDVPKRALRAYAAETKLRFREDASNACLDFQRNRIRHELLPMLREHYQPGLEKTIFRLADILGAQAELVEALAKQWLDSARGKRVAFEALPVAIQRNCLYRQVLEHGGNPSFDLIEQLRTKPGTRVSAAFTRSGTSERGIPAPRAAFETGDHGADGFAPEPGNLGDALGRRPVFRQTNGVLNVEDAGPSEFGLQAMQLDLTGAKCQQQFEGARLHWKIVAGRRVRPGNKCLPGCEYFDADRVGDRILLRHWQPGDRFQPIGSKQAVKLQDFFVNQKVPRARRHKLLVGTTTSGEVFWVEGMRIAERFKLTNGTNRSLQWAWKRL